MKLLELDKNHIADVFNALLTDGADNANMTIIHASEGESCADLCGYGDDDEKVGKGRYLLVWDNLNEDDQLWPSLYKVVNAQDFPYEGFDYLFPLVENDGQCVLIFKLTSD